MIHPELPMIKQSAFILLLFFGVMAQTAVAQSAPPPILKNEIEVNYPQNVRFLLELPSDTAVTAATLVYDVEKTSCLEAAAHVPVELTFGENGTTAEWTWVMSRSGNPPPGAVLWWEWVLTDADGATTTTPRQSYTFSDDRFNWRTIEADGIQLHWYRGDEVGPLLLDAAVAGLDRLENEMGIQLQDEVQIYIYGSAADMRDALLYVQDWAGGVAMDEYGTILMGVQPSSAEGWGRSTIRHELAHLVVGQFGRNCVGGHRPTWLNEGLAVYAEGPPAPDILADIDRASSSNSFEPLRSLNGSFSSHGQEAGIAYAQSYSVVDFLFDAYGQEKMQSLLLTLAEGTGYDEALEQVYGFNVDGLEQVWRESLGLPERAIPPTPTPIIGANVPTAVPLGKPENIPTPPAAAATRPAERPSTDEQPPAPTTGICGLGIVPFFLMGLIFTQKRRKNESI
jgi:hypothetical protein